MEESLYTSTPPKIITPEQKEQYGREGYFIYPKLYNASEINLMHDLRIRVEAESAGNKEGYKRNGAEYQIEPLVSDPTGEQVALRKIQEVYHSESSFRQVAASDKILDIVEDLIGPTIYYHSSKLMCKPAHGGRRKPWHQDFAYWADMQPKQVTVWGAIDPATRENGCIQVIPGSHLKGLVPHHNGEDYMIDEVQIDESDIVHAVMDPGDMLFFNVLLLHASAPNLSDRPRLSTIIDFDSRPGGEKNLYGSTTPLRTS